MTQFKLTGSEQAISASTPNAGDLAEKMMGNYSGSDNLMLMEEAVNYKFYLKNQVMAYARKGDYIVDFGAGIGTFAQQMCLEGFHVLCIEPDQRQKSILETSGLTVYEDIDQINDESVDYLYALNVLEHIENDQGIIKRIYQKLKHGGHFFVYSPAFPILFSSADRKVGHYRRYRKEELIAKMRHAGFRILYSRYADTLGFFVALLYRLFESGNGDLHRGSLIFYDRVIFPVSQRFDSLFGPIIGKNVAVLGKKNE
jgi:SAM-dependent methyltransferase